MMSGPRRFHRPSLVAGASARMQSVYSKKMTALAKRCMTFRKHQTASHSMPAQHNHLPTPSLSHDVPQRVLRRRVDVNRSRRRRWWGRQDSPRRLGRWRRRQCRERRWLVTDELVLPSARHYPVSARLRSPQTRTRPESSFRRTAFRPARPWRSSRPPHPCT